MAKSQTFEMKIVVVEVGGRFLAMTSLGGMNIRSEAAREPVDAVQGLFVQLGQPHHGNAVIGIGLALDGTNLDAEIATIAGNALGQGDATDVDAH